jgi:hypothetical protein
VIAATPTPSTTTMMKRVTDLIGLFNFGGFLLYVTHKNNAIINKMLAIPKGISSANKLSFLGIQRVCGRPKNNMKNKIYFIRIGWDFTFVSIVNCLINQFEATIWNCYFRKSL